jgi:hypothetical protein
MKAFAFVKNLGWAHINGEAVLCRLVTLRSEDHFLLGGSYIIGEVVEGEDGYDEVSYFHQPVEEETKKMLNTALFVNNTKEGWAAEKGEEIPRLASMPTKIGKPWMNSTAKFLDIVAFTEDDAMETAYKAGFRVEKFFYHGSASNYDAEKFPEYSGGYWSRLLTKQKRQADDAVAA